MVLRNARLYAFLDFRYHCNFDPRTMSYYNTLPALLLLPRCIRQEPVLALDHHLPIFWPAVLGPFVPRFLPTTIFKITGGVEWEESGAVQLAPAVCDWVAFGVEPVAEYSVPGERVVELAGVHLE